MKQIYLVTGIFSALLFLSGCSGTRVMHEKEKNRNTVDTFFDALENEDFDRLKVIFAEDARQLNPYVPAGFPTVLDGNEAIYNQYSGLPELFGNMSFPRTIIATEDPNLFFVTFRGEIDIKAGGRYENDYIGVFRLEDGKIIEYFNPIVMAKAFNISLDDS